MPQDPQETKPSPRPSIGTLIKTGRLRPPAVIFATYRGQRLTATIESDGTISVNGKRYPSLSAAASGARVPFFGGDLKGKGPPATNGWEFWRIDDDRAASQVTIDQFARRA